MKQYFVILVIKYTKQHTPYIMQRQFSSYHKEMRYNFFSIKHRYYEHTNQRHSQ